MLVDQPFNILDALGVSSNLGSSRDQVERADSTVITGIIPQGLTRDVQVRVTSTILVYINIMYIYRCVIYISITV